MGEGRTRRKEGRRVRQRKGGNEREENEEKGEREWRRGRRKEKGWGGEEGE